MKIGIFDSGLGGLIIAKAIIKKLPAYDYLYLGDTQNLPYGSKNPRQIFEFTKLAVDFLFAQDCQLIIVACNTSSALALRKIQQKYLASNYPNRRVLGVVIPTLEVADNKYRREKIGVIGTTATIKSHIYKKELVKIDRKAKIIELATPNLVPLIEANSLQKTQKSLELYLKPLKKQGIEALILGCTHYPILKKGVKGVMGKKVAIISQDEIIPGKLADYLKRHSEITQKLSKKGKREFWVTSKSGNFDKVAARLFGKKINFGLAKY